MNLRLMLIPQWIGHYLFCLYLSFTKELFPLHLGHHTARLVMILMVLSEKRLQNKKVSPPSPTEAHPLRHLGWTITIFNFKLQMNTSIQCRQKAYLHILSKEKYFSYTRKKTCLYTLRWNLLLDNIKAISRRNPFRVIKPLPLLWSSYSSY